MDRTEGLPSDLIWELSLKLDYTALLVGYTHLAGFRRSDLEGHWVWKKLYHRDHSSYDLPPDADYRQQFFWAHARVWTPAGLARYGYDVALERLHPELSVADRMVCLNVAVKYGYVSIVQRLILEHDNYQLDMWSKYAARLGHHDLYRYLTSKARDVGIHLPLPEIRLRDALRGANRDLVAYCVSEVLSSGRAHPDVKLMTKYAHIIGLLGRPDLLELLKPLDATTAKNETVEYHRSNMMSGAAEGSHIWLMEDLRAEGVKVANKNLIRAARGGDVEVFKWLLKEYAKPPTSMCFVVLISRCHAQTALYLLKHHFPTQDINWDYLVSLVGATRSVELLEWLLNEPRVVIKDRQYTLQSALHWCRSTMKGRKYLRMNKEVYDLVQTQTCYYTPAQLEQIEKAFPDERARVFTFLIRALHQ